MSSRTFRSEVTDPASGQVAVFAGPTPEVVEAAIDEASGVQVDDAGRETPALRP